MGKESLYSYFSGTQNGTSSHSCLHACSENCPIHLCSLGFPSAPLFLPSIFCWAAGLIGGGNLNRGLGEGAMPL